MSTTRTAMADRVNIGQTWRRRRDGAEFSVRQVWRADREARLIRPGEGTFPTWERLTVSFSDLRRFWEQVS